LGIPLSPLEKKPAKGKDDADSNIPEWMSKFKKMGIKADENEDEAEAAPEPARTRPAGFLKQSRSQSFVAKSVVSPSLAAATSAASKEAKGDGKPEWMQKFKKSGQKIEEVPEPEPPAPEPAPTQGVSKGLSSSSDKASGDAQPEWMQKFKQIGMKGEARVVLGAPAPVPAPVPTPSTPLQVSRSEGKWKAGSLEGAPAQEPQLQSPPGQQPKPSSAEAGKNAPEWMLKFKQIGQKGEEQVILGKKGDGSS
jgi:hypothetical protein